MKNLHAYGLYVLISLGVMLPLLLPGFILTLDMVFTPKLPMPQEVTSSYPFHAALQLINVVLPGDVVQKLLLVTILPLASMGMHRLVRTVARRGEVDWGIYIASIFYAINPFTYSRFMAGQYAVLLGYALLPWLARLLIVLLRRPDWRNAIKLGLLITLVGVLSIHTLAAVVILIGVGAVINLKRTTVLRYGAVAMGVALLLSSYWLVPLALGQGKTADVVAGFSTADTQAFATTGGNPIARAGNMLRLQGFWAEGKDLYLLPQDRMVLWGLMMLAVLALVVVGGVMLWRKRPRIVLWLGGSALLAIVLAAGTLGPWTADIPIVAGLREPHKLVALVALTYSLLLAFGVNAALARIREAGEAWYSAVAVVTLLLPFAIMRVMLWGFDGQLSPRHYPADWLTAKQVLSKNDGNILFVPWHQYMTFGFAGRTIANPAPAFFGWRVLVSQDPELGGASGGTKNDQENQIVTLLQNAKAGNDIAAALAKQNIAYILLAKEIDYKEYDYLQRQPGLQIVHDSSAVMLYKNQAWRQP